MLANLKKRISQADLPDPVFAVLGAADLARSAPGSLGRYYTQLVDRGHTRLVEAGAQRAVHKRMSRVEKSVTPTARKWAVRYKQRQRRRMSA